MKTYTCQPQAMGLPVWVKWDHGVVEDRIAKKKDGSGVNIKDVATAVERLFEEGKKSPMPMGHITLCVALGWFQVH
jgi:hypothetical protein